MAKYKVLEQFRDKHTKELYEVGEVIDMTVKRAKEAEKNLARHGEVFLERVDEPKEDESKEADQEETENVIEEGEK